MSVSSIRERSGVLDLIIARAGRANATLAVIAGAYLMIALDSTVVNVALPRIQVDLGFSPTGLAWVINAYLLAFGGLLLLGGRLGDVLGRRRVFVTGVALFTAASVVAGISTSGAWLVAARAAQGVGGAMATPNTMALLATNFPEGPSRNRALSVYSAVAMGGASIGLVLGGILTTYATWRWALFINLPIGIAIGAVAPRLLEDTEPRRGRLDVAGAISSTLGMTSIVFGLIHAGSDGWDRVAFGALAVGLAFLAAFLVVEARAPQPIVPLHLLRDRRRLGAYFNLLLLPTAIFGPFFFLTQFMQDVRGFGPLASGVAFLPQTTATIVAARFAPRLVARFGPVRLLTAGGLLVVVGVAWLSRIGPASQYLTAMLVPMLLVGTGVGWSFMPLNVTVLSGVPGGEAGAASAVAQAMQWVGGSLGLAVLVTVFGNAARAGASVAATAGPASATSAALVFTRGMSAALSVGILCAATTILVALVVLRPRRSAAPSA